MGEIQEKARHDYLRLAYETAIADIKFLKRQQWLVTHYSILLYVAIVYTSIHLKQCSYFFLLPFLFLITICIPCCAIVILLGIQKALEKTRTRKDEIHQKINESYRDRYFNSLFDPNRSEKDESIFLLLIIVSLVGAVITFILLFNSTNVPGSF